MESVSQAVSFLCKFMVINWADIGERVFEKLLRALDLVPVDMETWRNDEMVVSVVMVSIGDDKVFFGFDEGDSFLDEVHLIGYDVLHFVFDHCWTK